MTLELNRLTRQVDAMGQQIASRRNRLSGLGAEAAALLTQRPDVTEELLRKIERARDIDEWRRGAVPRGSRLDERRPVDRVVPQAVLIAADGSQIFPDRNAAAAYYLLNTGTIVFRKGSGQAPECDSRPQLFYKEEDIYDEDGNVRSEEYVGAQRNKLELGALADLAVKERERLGGDLSVPIVVLIDGPLLPWIRSATDNLESINEQIDDFAGQMERLRSARAIPIGYVDRPRSAYVLRILELLDMPIEAITRESLRRGKFIGLTDRELFAGLGPNERTGLFTPNSQSNERYYSRTGRGDRIAFCYANMARPGRDVDAEIARLEMPGWVADDPDLLDAAQAVISANCEPGPFPYVLVRAHELAVVTDEERAVLEELLAQVMWRNGLVPEISTKAWTKQLTRRPRRS